MNQAMFGRRCKTNGSVAVCTQLLVFFFVLLLSVCRFTSPSALVPHASVYNMKLAALLPEARNEPLAAHFP